MSSPATPSQPDEVAPLAMVRVLDAAANRASEALRVTEDYVRMVLDDAVLSRECKELRHSLAALLERLPAGARLAARDTQADVGVGISTERELTRSTPLDVAIANCHRAAEALRSLTEFGKLSDPAWALACEQLRYRLYTLEKGIGAVSTAATRLATCRLYVLVDGGASPESFARLIDDLVAARVSIVQLRDKRLSDRDLASRARLARSATRGSDTLLVINDRADIAALSDADGVHVGQDELSVKDARTIIGPGRLVGVSTHSLPQLRAAIFDGADYVGVGPTFPSQTKRFTHFAGLDYVRQAAANTRLPAFAIGGISFDNVEQVIAAGLSRVVVGAAITQAAAPAAAARQLLEILSRDSAPAASASAAGD